jgi:hypothetical protein
MNAPLRHQPATANFSITIEPGQEEMWFALRDLPGRARGFTAADLAHVAGVTATKAEIYLLRLVRHGVITQPGMTDGRKPLFAAPKLGALPRVFSSNGRPDADYELRDALWTAIRIRKSFSLNEILQDAKVRAWTTLAKVQAFVSHLEGAGYLTRLEGHNRRGEDEWMLRPAMNTGRIAPRLCEARLAYDINRGTFFGVALAREVRL